MKKLLFSLVILLSFSSMVEGISAYRFYKKLVRKEKVGVVREYWTTEITPEILENRGDDLIFEKCIGICTSRKGDGQILGLDDPYNYISYRSVKGIQKGDIILTIFIYEPGNRYVDDIACRFYFIIDKQQMQQLEKLEKYYKNKKGN